MISQRKTDNNTPPRLERLDEKYPSRWRLTVSFVVEQRDTRLISHRKGEADTCGRVYRLTLTRVCVRTAVVRRVPEAPAKRTGDALSSRFGAP